MFKVTTNPTFTHPVDVLVPTDGGHEKQQFKATFRVQPTAREVLNDLATAEGSSLFLRDVVVAMDDLADADGRPLPYSDAVRDQLLDVPYVRAALARTYFTAVTKATVGN